MSSFEKFMKDLELMQEKKRASAERMQKAEQAHNQKDRVRLYTERWQNSIRFLRGKK